MSLKVSAVPEVPEETARVARKAFRKGNVYLTMRDEMGVFYDDALFSAVFAVRGQSAEAPWRVALVSVMQFMEGLSDRQAADAVQSRIDWKYALSLPLDDEGFHYSILSEFRDRLIAGDLGQTLLDRMLVTFQERGWLKARGQQRTDSTHVLAAIRTLNRLETVGETLRATLNTLATVAPKWLCEIVPPAWYERYSLRVEEARLPRSQTERTAYGKQVGVDGLYLLETIWAEESPGWLRQLPAVEVLRQVWLQEYVVMEGEIQLRAAGDLPPAGARIESPYDPDARYARNRQFAWSGYKVHLTESCDEGQVHLITHVETTPAPIQDADLAAPVHTALADKALLPAEHFLDAGYVDAALIVQSQTEHQVEVVGPVRPDSSWQGQTEGAYDTSAFAIDWANQRATCPQGHPNRGWNERVDSWGNRVILIQWARPHCRLCPVRERCVQKKNGPRHITVRPEAEHKALQAARQAQQTPEWQVRYQRRAGVEGTISQGVRAFDLRQSRYVGLEKTALQHLLIAASMNVVRMAAWLGGVPHRKTQPSRFAALAPVA